MYVLDEPTTGLHFEDIRKLLMVLSGLVDKGNTVIVIEHNLDVIKTADWIIDMGPEGGNRGGLLFAAGTPEEVAEVPGSHTGHYLRRALRLAGEPSGAEAALARAAKANGQPKAAGTTPGKRRATRFRRPVPTLMTTLSAPAASITWSKRSIARTCAFARSHTWM